MTRRLATLLRRLANRLDPPKPPKRMPVRMVYTSGVPWFPNTTSTSTGTTLGTWPQR